MACKWTKLRKISPVQFFPSPSYPGLHVQLKDPLVLLQTALELQMWVPVSIYPRKPYEHYIFL